MFSKYPCQQHDKRCSNFGANFSNRKHAWPPWLLRKHDLRRYCNPRVRQVLIDRMPDNIFNTCISLCCKQAKPFFFKRGTSILFPPKTGTLATFNTQLYRASLGELLFFFCRIARFSWYTVMFPNLLYFISEILSDIAFVYNPSFMKSSRKFMASLEVYLLDEIHFTVQLSQERKI